MVKTRMIPAELLCYSTSLETQVEIFRLRSVNERVIFTGAQPSPKAGTGLKMQTVRFFNVTLLGIYR